MSRFWIVVSIAGFSDSIACFFELITRFSIDFP